MWASAQLGGSNSGNIYPGKWATYIFGGSDGGSSNIIQRWDGTRRTTESATTTTSIPYTASRLHTNVYVYGEAGSNGNINKWDSTTVSEVYIVNNGLAAGKCSSSKLDSYNFIFGVWDETHIQNPYLGWSISISRWDGSNYSIRTAFPPPINGNYSGHASSQLNSYIYVFGGGYNGMNGINKIFKFASSDSLIEESATLSDILHSHSTSRLNSYIYIFGGIIASDIFTTNIIQRWDGTTRTTESATLANTLSRHSSSSLPVNLSTYTYIFGGYTHPYGQSFYWNNTIQRWDGTTRTTESATLANTLSGHSSATLSWDGL